MQKIKWALIGCGKVVLQNKTTPFINRYNKIVAICTTNIDHSNAAIDKLKLKKCNGYDNVFKMLEKESIDAIIGTIVTYPTLSKISFLPTNSSLLSIK